MKVKAYTLKSGDQFFQHGRWKKVVGIRKAKDLKGIEILCQGERRWVRHHRGTLYDAILGQGFKGQG